MNDRLLEKCYEFMMAQRMCRESFGIWAHHQLDPVCACILISSKSNYDEDKLRYCMNLVRSSNSIFSSFRGNAEPVLATYLAADDHPDEKMRAAIDAYRILREYFPASSFLALTAMFMTEMTDPMEYRRAAEDTKYIYDRITDNHFFLTGREDTLFSFLIAHSCEDYGAALNEMEELYRQMKGEFLFSRNSLQSLCHALVLCSGDTDDKVRRFHKLNKRMENEGLEMGKGYEMISLGILANLGVDHDQVMADIVEADAFLSEQKEYGFFGFWEKKRLMHVIMILTSFYLTSGPELIAAVVVSVLIEIQQQQAAAAAAAAA